MLAEKLVDLIYRRIERIVRTFENLRNYLDSKYSYNIIRDIDRFEVAYSFANFVTLFITFFAIPFKTYYEHVLIPLLIILPLLWLPAGLLSNNIVEIQEHAPIIIIIQILITLASLTGIITQSNLYYTLELLNLAISIIIIDKCISYKSKIKKIQTITSYIDILIMQLNTFKTDLKTLLKHIEKQEQEKNEEQSPKNNNQNQKK